MPLFDSLVHVTRDGSWLGGRRYDARLERLLSDMDRAKVERACLVAIADYVDNEIVAEVAGRYPERFVPVGSINPAAYGTNEEVEKAVAGLAAQGFRGLKLHPRLNGYDPLELSCITAIRAAGSHGLVVLLDTLFRQRRRLTRHPTDVIDQLAVQCTGTSLILLHAAGPCMLELMELVCLHPHLVLDLSFSLLRYQGSSLDMDIRYLCQRLDQRIVMGSDFPEYLPSQALAQISQLTQGLPEEKLHNILFRNLDRLFPLDPRRER